MQYQAAPSMLRTVVGSLSLVATLAGTAAAADDAPAASTSKVETTKATRVPSRPAPSSASSTRDRPRVGAARNCDRVQDSHAL
jgi:hypothetical protein